MRLVDIKGDDEISLDDCCFWKMTFLGPMPFSCDVNEKGRGARPLLILPNPVLQHDPDCRQQQYENITTTTSVMATATLTSLARPVTVLRRKIYYYLILGRYEKVVTVSLLRRLAGSSRAVLQLQKQTEQNH
jgi:hypothetical protein